MLIRTNRHGMLTPTLTATFAAQAGISLTGRFSR
jgi:hypothetical protein